MATVGEFLRYLFSPDGFMPHGQCLAWAPSVLSLHILGDVLTGVAYYSIPLAIYYFLYRREDFEFPWMAHLFAAFIFLCGTTHLAELVTLWFPYYGIEGALKVITGGVSLLTALLLWPLVPRLLRVPSPTDLRQANLKLTQEVSVRERTETELRRAHDLLEERVQERTRELRLANQQLQAEINERRKVEESLKEALAEKDVLFREVHHRVKNNLQVITSLLNMQRRNVASELVEHTFQDAEIRIRALSLVHNFLYTSGEIERLDLGKLLKKLCEQLWQVHGVAEDRIRLDYDVPSLSAGMETALPMALLVTEAVTNSLRYGFTDDEEGTIRVRLRTADDHSVLEVSDNGHGFDTEEAGHKDSMGLQLMEAMAAQLDATLTMRGDDGTTVTLALKMSDSEPTNKN